MSGSIAAIASTMANLVAMWRILMSVACHVRHTRGSPEPKGTNDVASLFFVDIEARAYRPDALAPGEKNCRRVLDHRLLKVRCGGPVFVIIARQIDGIERRIDLSAGVMAPVEGASRMPEQTLSKEAWSD